MAKAGNPSPVAYLQYEMPSTTALGAVVGTWTTIVLSTDLNSFPNSYLDKPTTSRFRALFDCTVRVSYRCRISPSGNNVGVDARLLLNGTTDVGNRSHVRDGANRTSAAENNGMGATCLVDLNANDYIELQGSPAEAAAVSFQTDQTMMLVELVRLR
jgi:hypothetical protein